MVTTDVLKICVSLFCIHFELWSTKSHHSPLEVVKENLFKPCSINTFTLYSAMQYMFQTVERIIQEIRSLFKVILYTISSKT